MNIIKIEIDLKIEKGLNKKKSDKCYHKCAHYSKENDKPLKQNAI